MNDCRHYRLLVSLLLSVAIVFVTFSGCDLFENNAGVEKSTSVVGTPTNKTDNSVNSTTESPITTLPREEKYSVELVFPENGHVFDKNDPPPIFTWNTYENFPNFFVIEFVYESRYDASLIEIGYDVYYSTAFSMEEPYRYMWDSLKESAKVVDGKKEYTWRILVTQEQDKSIILYSTEWRTFGIKN